MKKVRPHTHAHAHPNSINHTNLSFIPKEWILTDEEKALKRRRHRHYAFERSVADSTGNESKAGKCCHLDSLA